MKNIPITLCVVLLFSLTGCAGRISLDEAVKTGATPLNADTIEALVSGQSIHMMSWSKADEADVNFSAKGKLNALNSVGESTYGRWRTDDEKNTLCLQFKYWGNGDKNCYKVFKDNDHYLLFNNDGTLANTFVPKGQTESTLTEMNAGVLTLPPPGSSPKKLTTPIPAAVPATTPTKEAGLLSTLTFGLLGGDEADIEPEAAPVARQEFVPQPLVTGKVLSQPHQQLLDTGDCPGCDLAEIDLSGTKLKGANLEGADLSGANLQEVNLKGANLKGTNLHSARLTDAILINADLENADLSDANLHWADLSKANLKNSNMERAYLIKAFFYKADLTGANMSGVQTQRTIFEEAVGVPEHLLLKNKNTE